MDTVKKRRTVLGACFAVGVFAAASLGYVAGSASSLDDRPGSGNVTEALAFTAVSAGGATSTLTGEDAATYEENTTPLDQNEVTFAENMALSAEDVGERKSDLSENYAVGEALSAEDLEFMRAYLIDAEPSSSETTPTIDTAAFTPAGANVAPAALYNLNQSFNETRSGAGATANAKGSITGGINLADASWGVNWTTKRTAGKALTKITSSVTADAFGAVAAWPFVGKIYTKTLSSTSPNGASSWAFSRTGRVTGAVAYMQIDCRSYVYTNSGSFSLP